MSETQEGLYTFSSASEIKSPAKKNNRIIKSELDGEAWQQAKVDALEKSLGYPEKKENTSLVKNKIRVFNPEDPGHEQLLEQLLNSPKYKIINWNATWTKSGQHKICVVYAEFDVKEEK